jgi:HAD superfamily phosphatase (TIGR01668 family)
MPFLTPDDFVSSVTSISPVQLQQQGFHLVLLDLDNTLVPRGSHRLPDDVRQWVASLKPHGLRACLLSNNWHSVVFGYAKELELPIVYKAMKPLPFSYGRALKKLEYRQGEQVVAIGDQLITDVWGAHLRGFKAILVLPQAEKDLWHTNALRNLERLIIGNRQPRI